MSTKKYEKFSLFEVIGTVPFDNAMIKKQKNMLCLTAIAWHAVCCLPAFKSIKGVGFVLKV